MTISYTFSYTVHWMENDKIKWAVCPTQTQAFNIALECDDLISVTRELWRDDGKNAKIIAIQPYRMGKIRD